MPIVPQRDQPDVYVPQPGSPLRIPVLDIHRGGISGDPRTIQTTEDTTRALKEACEKVFRDAKFETDDTKIERQREKYYNFERIRPGTTKGASFADEWMGMIKVAKDLTIHFITDSYTPKVDGTPTKAEDGRYMKLEHNIEDQQHVVLVRVPKAWKLGQGLNKERLQEATKEVCEQIKKMIDEGAIRPDNRSRIRRLLKDLVEPKKKPSAPKADKDVYEPPR